MDIKFKGKYCELLRERSEQQVTMLRCELLPSVSMDVNVEKQEREDIKCKNVFAVCFFVMSIH